MAAKKNTSAAGVLQAAIGKVIAKTEAGPVVTTRCVGCKKTREIRAGEVAPGDHPMCDDCGMPMIAVGAKGTRR